MATLTIMDPITRIEGHLKVEVEIGSSGGQQQVVDARCTGTLFRGFETVLQGRDSKDAPVITQRICGVCPISHGMAAVMAAEKATGATPPADARILRNLTLGANFLQSHILHFYVLAAADFVTLPQQSPWSPAWDHDLKSSAELTAVGSHLVSALEARAKAHEMGAVFGGKMPHSHTYIPGGFTATPTAQRIARFGTLLNELRAFIDQVYLPDVAAVAAAYPEYFQIGAGVGNLLAYGVFEQDDQGVEKLLMPGYVVKNDPQRVNTFQEKDIREYLTHSWYKNQDDGLAPAAGRTTPEYPKTDAYSWLKSPRYQDQPFEVGPLARMWVNGDYQNGLSVLDRHAARAQECQKVAEAMATWLDELTQDGRVYGGYNSRATGSGSGLTEAPRGALGHWVTLNAGQIAAYQIITPTCWNASPRDAQGQPGPLETALIGTPVADPDRPVEALRVIHSFDPCLSCAVHLMRPGKKPLVVHTRS
ncbi:MAG: nickel-dependent hydrogenase large subunit [Deltaproteobacteria bacterium]|nr:nickel-dependent hydrogenase large subunit [Deltaproteobacteria bacterium]